MPHLHLNRRDMKILSVLIVALFLVSNAFADNRISLTRTVYRAGTSTLVKRGDAKVYSLAFIATANNGDFMILDALTDTTIGAGSISDVRSEGKQATSGNTYLRDFIDHPLEVSTGLYIVVNNGYLTVTYD